MAEILGDKRPRRVVAAIFLDMAFGSAIANLRTAARAGLQRRVRGNLRVDAHPDHTKANMWGEMQDWLLKGAIETDEKMAMYLADPTTGIWR